MLPTFIVIDCKKRKNLLVTLSSRQAKRELHTGLKVEVWNDSMCVETIYATEPNKLDPYTRQEKERIGEKQRKAEQRNKRRKNHGV